MENSDPISVSRFNSIRMSIEGNLIKVRLPYDQSLIGLMKKIPYRFRKWDKDRKIWEIDAETDNARYLVRSFRNYMDKIPDEIIRLADFSSGEGSMERRKNGTERRIIPRTPPSGRRKNDLLGTFRTHLVIRNYGKRTISLYVQILKDFIHDQGIRIAGLSADEINGYLAELVEKRKVSFSRINQVISALKFAYEKMFNRPDAVKAVDRPRKEHKIPEVLDRDEVLRIIDAVDYPKHKLMISLLYSSGLRLSELVSLKVKDIDLKNLMIFVRDGKGHKDRRTIFSERLVSLLEKQMKGKGADEWLFYGEDGERHYSQRSVQKILGYAVKKTGIRKHVHCHTLRHCFATHLLENGTDIRYIQDLLGHSHLTTTEIYTKVRNPAIRLIRSPL